MLKRARAPVVPRRNKPCSKEPTVRERAHKARSFFVELWICNGERARAANAYGYLPRIRNDRPPMRYLTPRTPAAPKNVHQTLAPGS